MQVLRGRTWVSKAGESSLEMAEGFQCSVSLPISYREILGAHLPLAFLHGVALGQHVSSFGEETTRILHADFKNYIAALSANLAITTAWR